jgi:hypothetical protein
MNRTKEYEPALLRRTLVQLVISQHLAAIDYNKHTNPKL